MIKSFVILPLLLCASPALAQVAPPAPPAPPPEVLQLPPELTDPATAQRLAGAMQAASNALLDMKVGGLRAALEGREPSARERNLTVRDLGRRKDPDFDRKLQRQMANVGPTMQRGMAVLNRALPEMQRSLAEAEQAIDRAVANLPDPTYPRQ